jgi:WD40 repeat protein
MKSLMVVTLLGFLVVGIPSVAAEPKAAKEGKPGQAATGISTTGPSFRLIGRVDTPHGFLRCIAFSPDGKWLAAATGCQPPGGSFHSPLEGTVVLIDVERRKVTTVLKSDCFGASDALAFSDDGSRVVACWYYGTVVIWNRRTGKREQTLAGPKEAGHAVVLLPGAKVGAWSCNDGNVRVWNLASQQQDAAFHPGIFLRLAMSPDAKHVAVAGSVIRESKSSFRIPNEKSEPVKVWNVRRGIIEATLKGHTEGNDALSFSRDGKLLVTGGDGCVRFWDLQTEKPILPEVKVQSGSVDELAFSPDGKLLATSGAFDPQATVVDVASRRIVAKLRWTDEKDPGSFVSVSFSPDGKRLAVAAEEGIVAFWSVPSVR